MVGLIAKVHHSVIDGVAGAELLAKLLDLTPEGSAVDRAVPALGPAAAALAGAAGDRRAAELHAQPGARRACGPRGRPHGGAPGPLRRRRRASGPISIPLGAPDTFESPVGADRAVSFAELDMARGAGAQGRASARRSTTSCSPCARGRCAPTWPRTTRTSTARWWRWSRCRCAATRRDAALGNQLSAMFVPLSNDKQDAARAAAHRDRGQRLVQGPGARRRLRPDGDAAGRGRCRRRWPSR